MFIRNFRELDYSASNAFIGKPSVTEVKVEMVRIDDFVNASSIKPALIKIDVEGFELNVLKGLTETIRRRFPKDYGRSASREKAIFHMLHGTGYRMFNCLLSSCSRPTDLFGNIFALHANFHEDILKDLQVAS